MWIHSLKKWTLLWTDQWIGSCSYTLALIFLSLSFLIYSHCILIGSFLHSFSNCMDPTWPCWMILLWIKIFLSNGGSRVSRSVKHFYSFHSSFSLRMVYSKVSWIGDTECLVLKLVWLCLYHRQILGPFTISRYVEPTVRDVWIDNSFMYSILRTCDDYCGALSCRNCF